jgi:hypothetical protein
MEFLKRGFCIQQEILLLNVILCRGARTPSRWKDPENQCLTIGGYMRILLFPSGPGCGRPQTPNFGM